ncbi:hypothetical protein DL96DRAFT_1825622 [Flagelloscypha sp. PMI_526]|nr:hypothetical protein DL96DRAFT_1825622 [Flagelloscypha sp. PMI_526]
MSTLPLDIFPHIFDSLKVHGLMSCSTVCRDMHQMTQRLLFSQLRLTGWQWEEQCQLFLNIATEARCSLVKKLIIELDGLPVHQEDEVSPNLLSLLVKFGPRCAALHINGFVCGKVLDDWPTGTEWPELSPTFVDCLFQHVMPSVRTLRFHEVGQIPIFLVFAHCPLLRDLWLGSLYLDGPQTNVTRKVGPGPMPKVVSLMLKPFSPGDLEETTPLAHFIKESGRKITTLHLNQKEAGSILPCLVVLKPFPDLKDHLQHLYFGRRFHLGIMEKMPLEFNHADLLPLASLPNLQTLTFPMYRSSSHKTQEAWDYWFKWVVAVINFAGDSIPTSLKVIRFIRFPEISSSDSFDGTPHSLDELHDRAHFSLEFVVSKWIRKQTPAEVFTLLRATLPSWEAAGRLSFQIKM